MGRFARMWGPRLLGSDRTKTRWFLTHAISLYGLTAGIAALGNVLLSRWPQLYAHLIIELVAVLVFLSTVGMAIANAYINDGVLTSVVVTVAPLAGLFGYLFIASAAFGTATLAPLTLDTLLSLGAGAGAISLGSYLLGRLLYLQQLPRLEQTVEK